MTPTIGESVQTTEAPSGGDLATRRSALLVSALSSFMTPFMGSSVNIALPSIGKAFGMEAVLLSWVATSYILSATVFLLPFGRIADIIGRKRIFSWGILLFTASSLLVASAPSVFLLISFRVIQGVGSAMVFGTGPAILSAVYPPGERGRALGINVAAVYSGLSLGPFIGGFLTQHFGWRSVFLSALPLGLLILWTIWQRLHGEWADARGERFDLVGSLLYGIALVAIIRGLSLLPGRNGFWMIASGGLCLAGFVAWEARTASPVLDLRHLRENRVFALSNLAALIHYSSTSAVGFLLSLYLQMVRGFAPQGAGLLLVCQPVIQTLFSPFAGKLSDRIEPRTVASLGMACTGIGLVMLTAIGTQTPLPYIVSCMAFLGFGFAMFSSPNANAIMGSVERRYYGVASGMLGTSRLTGNMLSMGVVMLVFSLFLGGGQITPQTVTPFLASARTIFVVFCVLCCGGILASLARGKVR